MSGASQNSGRRKVGRFKSMMNWVSKKVCGGPEPPSLKNQAPAPEGQITKLSEKQSKTPRASTKKKVKRTGTKSKDSRVKSKDSRDSQQFQAKKFTKEELDKMREDTRKSVLAMTATVRSEK